MPRARIQTRARTSLLRRWKSRGLQHKSRQENKAETRSLSQNRSCSLEMKMQRDDGHVFLPSPTRLCTSWAHPIPISLPRPRCLSLITQHRPSASGKPSFHPQAQVSQLNMQAVVSFNLIVACWLIFCSCPCVCSLGEREVYMSLGHTIEHSLSTNIWPFWGSQDSRNSQGKKRQDMFQRKLQREIQEFRE